MGETKPELGKTGRAWSELNFSGGRYYLPGKKAIPLSGPNKKFGR